MNILITNSCLATLGGSESFVRDLGCTLKNLGHTVMAYSHNPGDARRLSELTMVESTDNLRELKFRPDVIHAQHHLDAMAAIMALPGVPALYHCHGGVWRETPPRHPRIYHYLAMSRTLAERISIEANIPPANISVWLNTVDIQRFTTVRQLPTRPARALFYNKIHHSGSPTVAAIREATSKLGLSLDFIGRKFGPLVSNPETVLPNYDIVFASGRSAIDALACGCAVVVLGRTSCGEMVVPENYDRIRGVNFSIAVNSAPATAEKIETQLRRYDATDCAQISQRLRGEADARLSGPKLMRIYEDVIATHLTTPADLPEEMRAAARYLRQMTPLILNCEHVLRSL